MMRARRSYACCTALGIGALLLQVGCSKQKDPVGDGGGMTTGAGNVERGEELFSMLRCPQCHGADATGLSVFPFGPNIVGRSAEDLRIKVREECSEATVLCHPLRIEDITDQALEDLAAFLATLGGGTAFEMPGPVCSDEPGTICTLAGNGVQGNRSGNLLAREQFMFWPQNVELDPQGRVLITDYNNYLVRRIENEGCREIVDDDGREGEDCPVMNVIGAGVLGDDCTTPERTVLADEARMSHIVGLHFDELIPGQRNIILWGWHNYKIKYIAVDENGDPQELYCLFGNDDGATEDGLPAGYNFDGEGGPTRFSLPTGAVHDREGNFYISDQGSLRIRVVRTDENDDFSSPESLVETMADNIITTIAGGQQDSGGNFIPTALDYSDSGDGGPAVDGTFRTNTGLTALPEFRIAIDRERNLLYVADTLNNRIRVLDLNEDPPTIDTFAGGGSDIAADGVPATEAALNQPYDVDVAPDGSGDLLISDTANNCIRLVDFETRLITTVAGICDEDMFGYEGDGGPAVEARLDAPGGATIGPDRTIYIADTQNNRVRRVNPPSAEAPTAEADAGAP